MDLKAELPTCRVQLALCEEPAQRAPDKAPAILWQARLSPPPLELPNFSQITVGRWYAPTSTAATVMRGSDGIETVRIDADVRFLSQLRHAILREPGDILPVGLDSTAGAGPVLAGVAKEHLEAIIEATELRYGFGPRTQHFSPPVYLREFWGYRPFHRAYGELDRMLAQMARIKLMPKELFAKARDPTARNNWAVVIPANLADRQQIISALFPLINYRRGIVMELRDGLDPATVDEFISRIDKTPIEDRPPFMLLIGGLDELSIEFQYFLQSFAAAGRLHFENVEDYGRYADKVIRHEATLRREPPLAVFAATDTDDVAELNADELVRPLAMEFGSAGMPPVLAHGRVTKARLLELGRNLPQGSILFLAAHGYESRRSAEHELYILHSDQRSFQGAPILDDFRHERMVGSSSGLLCGSDLAGDVRFVPGGVVMLHACYSAGTVDRDTLPEWIHIAAPSRLKPERPFVSRLCQAMLTSRAGPIAVYGHINRSHQYAYFDPQGSGESMTLRQYRDLLKALMRGDPIGLGRDRARRMALQYMSQALLISQQIRTADQRMATILPAWERAFVQYSFGSCNFRNYIILGDPMVRLKSPPNTEQGATT
jgi:hypothetical protein